MVTIKKGTDLFSMLSRTKIYQPPFLFCSMPRWQRMAVTGFVLSGIEYIDGCAYAQSWWCREG